MTLLAYIVGVFCGIGIMAFTTAPVVDEPWQPPWWMTQRHYYYRRGGRLFDIQTTPEQFRRLCERMNDE